LPLPHVTYVTGRGPFAEADDRALMTAHGIEIVVAKNSGGAATYGKIAAARALGIDVIMLRRPPRARGAGRRDGRGRDRLARSCAHLRRRRAACKPAATSGPRDHARLARADDDERRHVGLRRVGASSVTTLTRSSGRPTARPNTTGVDWRQMPAQPLDRIAELPRPRPRDRIVERDDKAGAAAASSRRSIKSHGLRLSDSDSAQKSWPSGAPIRAATASIAVMPGTMVTSSARQLPARLRSPRRPPPPWRRRRDRRRRRPRRAHPARHDGARRRRACVPRGCRRMAALAGARGTRSR
jgi:hypothetical protein